MLRAIRFATQLEFNIVPEALASITANADRMTIVSRERCTEELHKILACPKPSTGFLLLEKNRYPPAPFARTYRAKRN